MDITYRDLRDKVNSFSGKNNFIAFFQFFSTLSMYMLTWIFYFKYPFIYNGFLFPFVMMFIILINVRLFSLMHDCGHGALFNGRFFNKLFGFILGVLMGVPCYLWARDHAYHHKTNGDWESYPGALEVITLEQYRALSARQRAIYRFSKSLWIAPFVGFFYLIVNPRCIYLFHVLSFFEYQLRRKIPKLTLERQRPAFVWPRTLTRKEFIHMTLNNLFFIGLVSLFCFQLGTFHFLFPFFVSLSLAGSIVFLIFISQHNFENSFAATKANANLLKGCLNGTAYLVLPRLLNYFTADIAYHHVHHISAKIPNYRLKECHDALSSYFTEVHRMRLKDMFTSLKFNLWDVENQTLITCKQFDVLSDEDAVVFEV